MPIYPVIKPLGLTSHDVVARARRLLGTRRVGHAGTLDPLATGVLVVLAEDATKLSQFLTASNKRYLAWVALGAGTPTLDAEGPITETATAEKLTRITPEHVADAASQFAGVTMQRPPAFSAIKQQGQRSYAAARQGNLEEPPERPVAYHNVELLGFAASRQLLPQLFAPGPHGWRHTPEGTELTAGTAGSAFDLPPELAQLPTALFSLEVAAGTYIRSFARDLGRALGVPAHLSGLVRTGAGKVDLSQCTPLDELQPGPGLDPLSALTQPKLKLDNATATAVRQGKKILLPVNTETVLTDQSGNLVAVVVPRTDVAQAPTGSTPDAVPVKILRAWQQ